jgi:hypothetical protein
MRKWSFRSCCLASLLILTGCFGSRQRALDRKWPGYKRVAFNSDALIPVGVGEIIKKNKDTLKGYIKMLTDYYAVPAPGLRDVTKINDVSLLPFGKEEKTDIIKVDLEDIDFVRIRLARDTAPTDYMPLRSEMWQMLGRKGRTSVCYQVWTDLYTKGSFFYEMFLVTGNKLTEIPITGANSGPFHPRYKYIVDFINKRYGEHMTVKDFGSRKDMVNYLLDKENQ